jgi:hypothetical protein
LNKHQGQKATHFKAYSVKFPSSFNLTMKKESFWYHARVRPVGRTVPVESSVTVEAAQVLVVL